MTVEVRPRPEISEDLRGLGSNDLRLEALRYIVALAKKPRLGQRLENLPHTGDLSDCRKLYFNEARHRIIYRLLPDDRRPTEVDVIAVGPREAEGVYVEAVRRLERGTS